MQIYLQAAAKLTCPIELEASCISVIGLHCWQIIAAPRDQHQPSSGEERIGESFRLAAVELASFSQTGPDRCPIVAQAGQPRYPFNPLDGLMAPDHRQRLICSLGRASLGGLCLQTDR